MSRQRSPRKDGSGPKRPSSASPQRSKMQEDRPDSDDSEPDAKPTGRRGISAADADLRHIDEFLDFDPERYMPRGSESSDTGSSDVTATGPQRTLTVQPLEGSPLFGPLPGALVESIQYLVNSRELSGEPPLSNRIAVTSSVRGEGVTTVSQAFASALADDFDSWVCWVDLSWARTGPPPRPTGKPGIFDLLDGRLEPDEVIRFIPEIGVACLGAGTVPANGRNVGRSTELEELIALLSHEFDHVVFDMPPVLESTTGLPLFRFAEEYLMVCKSGVTRSDQLESTTTQLNEIELIGTVLNEQKTRTPGFLQRMLIN